MSECFIAKTNVVTLCLILQGLMWECSLPSTMKMIKKCWKNKTNYNCKSHNMPKGFLKLICLFCLLTVILNFLERFLQKFPFSWLI